jgi:hypothetical protein
VACPLDMARRIVVAVTYPGRYSVLATEGMVICSKDRAVPDRQFVSACSLTSRATAAGPNIQSIDSSPSRVSKP